MTYRTIIKTFALLLLLAAFSCKRPSGVVEALPPFAGTDTSQVDIILAGLNLEEKIGQLILWDAPMTDSIAQAEVFQKTSAGLVGGVLLHDVHLATFLYATDSLKRSASIPLFIGTDEKVSLHNQFKGLLKFPLPATLAAIDSVSIHAYLEEKYVADCKALGINLTLNPTLKTDVKAAQGFDYQVFEEELPLLDERFDRVFEQLKSNRILAIADNFSKFEFIENDSLRRIALKRFQTKVNMGLGGFLVSNSVLSQDTLKVLPPTYPKTYLSRFLGFKGLMVVQLAQDEAPNKKLLAGAELLVTKEAGAVFKAVQALLKSGEMTEQDLNQRVRRVLLAKSWVHGGQLPIKLSILPQDTTTNQPVKFVSISEKRQPEVVKEYKPRSPNFDAKVDKTVCYFEDPRWGFYVGKLFGNSVILARDHQDFLPFKGIYDTDYQVFKYSKQPAKDFETLFSKYARYRIIDQPVPASGELKPLVFQKTSKVPAAIVFLDNVDLKPGFHKQFIESINELAKQSQVVLLNFGNPKNLRFFEQPVTIVQIFEKNPFTEAYAAQLLFGGVRSEGRLPVTVDETMVFGAGVRHQAVRLAFADAENVGIASDRLAGINAIAQTAITNGVFPGLSGSSRQRWTNHFFKKFWAFHLRKNFKDGPKHGPL